MKKKISFPVIFFGFLIHPRETVKKVIENNYYSFGIYLIVFYDLLIGFDPVWITLLAKYMPFSEAIIVAPVLWCGFGVGCYFFNSWATYWVGKKFEGKGSLQEVRAVYALAYAPMIIAYIIKKLFDLPAQINLISSSANLNDLKMEDFSKAVSPVSGILIFIFMIWSLFPWTIGLSEANKFSVGKSIKTSLILMLILIGVLLVVFVLIVLALIPKH
jgi:hypothetical protein